ncbi:3-oxoacyl-ACP synthase III family protein [Amycolatopsis sp. cmx-4-61]|uniref:3-oxoacyl-ACP synthase III family protein n=1 Tax=Amycolatopsis sp. cmx-4-61 TaxID=2790937 RepID=UPI00397C6877
MPGIVEFDFEFPTGSVSARAMADASGVPHEKILEITHCEHFPVLGDDEQAWELAVRAGASVLKRTGVAPERITHVLYCGSGQWDVPFWSPAAKVAHELGIENAHCFEVTNFCNASMTAVRIACDKLELGQADHVLVLIGDRLSRLLDYHDAGSVDLFNFGDSAAALLISGEGSRFEVLHSAMHTEPHWADYYTGAVREGRVLIQRNGHREGLTSAYVDNFRTLTGQTLTALGRDVADVAYLLINHGDRRMHERLLNELGLPAEKSVFNYHRFGHMGGADTLIAIRDLTEAGRLRDGDLLLLATSAMGFSWGITALEYRAE